MLNLLAMPAVAKKTCKKSLVILHLSATLSKKVKRYQDLNKDLHHRSNWDPTQQMNLVKKCLTTREYSGYYQNIHLKITVLFRHQAQLRSHQIYKYSSKHFTISRTRFMPSSEPITLPSVDPSESPSNKTSIFPSLETSKDSSTETSSVQTSIPNVI